MPLTLMQIIWILTPISIAVYLNLLFSRIMRIVNFEGSPPVNLHDADVAQTELLPFFFAEILRILRIRFSHFVHHCFSPTIASFYQNLRTQLWPQISAIRDSTCRESKILLPCGSQEDNRLA